MQLKWLGLALLFPALPCAAANLVSNGDFSMGNQSFDTDYVEYFKFNNKEGEYGVEASSKLFNPNFASFGDHTTGTGQMLLINGATTAGKFVWYQDFISLQANVDYEISYWARTAFAQSPAVLQLYLNLNLYGEAFTLPETTDEWRQYNILYNPGPVGRNISLAFKDTNTDANGNDFALDDISIVAVPEPGLVAPLTAACAATLLPRRKSKARPEPGPQSK